LLVWDKGSYTERFLALLPWTCELQSTLVHSARSLHYFLFPSHSGLCQFKITLFIPLQCIHQAHSSFRFPSLFLFIPCTFSLVCDPCPVILLHLFWVYNWHKKENLRFLAFRAWLTLLKMTFSSFIHLLANDKTSFFSVAEQNSSV
jgi:hypothetical protein